MVEGGVGEGKMGGGREEGKEDRGWAERWERAKECNGRQRARSGKRKNENGVKVRVRS